MAKEILIADSDKGDQEEFRRIYENSDYRLVFAENGEDALLRIKLFKPDLIIAGTGLSEKSGLELCETIKHDAELKHLPFLLLTGMFEEVSEKDRLRVMADGIISKPLREGEIVSLTDQLMEEIGSGRVQEGILEQEKEWTVLPEKEKPHVEKKEHFVLDELDEDDEEIIELVEVVEEPEPKMSIDDFVSTREAEPARAEPAGDIPPLDSWDRLFGEEKKQEAEPSEEAFEFILEGEEKETGPKADLEADREAFPKEDFEFSLKEEKDTGAKADLTAKQEASSDEELFEKIELEEILEKVERLQPAIEKEWPADEEVGRRVQELSPTPEGESPKWLDLGDFESALRTEVKAEEKVEPQEAGLQPFDFEELKEERTSGKELESLVLQEPIEEVSLDMTPPAAGMALEEESLSDLGEEELSPDLFEEALGEDEISFIGGLLEGNEEDIEILEEVEPAGFAQEGRPEIPLQEGQPESLREESEVQSFVREIQSRDLLTEAEPQGLLQKELTPSLSGEVEVPGFAQEVRGPELFKETAVPSSSQEAQTTGLFKEVGPPKAFLEEVHPPGRAMDRELEELIGKGVQEMMEGFITKVLPELTQNILNLTMERIETMVKEVIPDLAEKAIQEEIKRLQKEDKD